MDLDHTMAWLEEHLSRIAEQSSSDDCSGSSYDPPSSPAYDPPATHSSSSVHFGEGRWTGMDTDHGWRIAWSTPSSTPYYIEGPHTHQPVPPGTSITEDR